MSFLLHIKRLEGGGWDWYSSAGEGVNGHAIQRHFTLDEGPFETRYQAALPVLPPAEGRRETRHPDERHPLTLPLQITSTP
ncbi:hypothetical protein Dalu01_00101 [Deinococcus aluminii]|uniref:Uncharacterized protein n=1 Tax=Deinococcus aluminii TaxID=1656885 RepID=A0ABP9XAW3_9DEIO